MILSDNTKGAAFMAAALAGFASNDAAMKLATQSMSVAQAVVLRGIATTALIGVLVLAYRAWHLPRTRVDWSLMGLRMLAEIIMTWSFLEALVRMPIGNLHAIMQALPLTVALGAWLWLKEPLGWRRLVAIGVGFIGVLLIVRPGPEGFTAASTYALIAVASVTVRDLTARKLSPEISSLSISFITAVVVTSFFALTSLAQPWVPVSPMGYLELGIAAVAIFVGYYFSVLTMRVGDIGFSAPFRYTGLLWAILLGWLIFGDFPAPLTLVGAGIIVGTGLFTLYRERASRRRSRRAGA